MAVKKVGGEGWTMESDPGYVSSSGRASVRIMDAEVVASCHADEESLFRAAENCPKAPLLDAEPFSRQRGACAYSGTRGMVKVPSGKVAVQVEWESICTFRDGEPQITAKVLTPESLRRVYRRRAAEYARLAGD